MKPFVECPLIPSLGFSSTLGGLAVPRNRKARASYFKQVAEGGCRSRHRVIFRDMPRKLISPREMGAVVCDLILRQAQRR